MELKKQLLHFKLYINTNSNKADIVKVINKYVPDFMHIETGKHLDQKM